MAYHSRAESLRILHKLRKEFWGGKYLNKLDYDTLVDGDEENVPIPPGVSDDIKDIIINFNADLLTFEQALQQLEQAIEIQKNNASTYAKKAEIPTKVSVFENDAKYITKAEFDLNNNSINGIYAKRSEIPTDVSQLRNDANYVNQQTMNDRFDELKIPSRVGQLINDKGYITLSQVPRVDLTNYALKASLNDYVTGVELNSKGYLTQHQPLTDYVKKSALGDYASKGYVDGKLLAAGIAAGSIPNIDLSVYAKVDRTYTKQEVDSKIAAATTGSGGNFVTSNDLVAYAKTTDLNDYLKIVDAVDAYDKTETDNKIASAIAAITGLSLYTDHPIILVDVDTASDINTALSTYGEPNEYFYGVGAAESYGVFTSKAGSGNKAIVDKKNQDNIIPDNSVVIIEKKITATSKKEAVVALLINDGTGLKFIDLDPVVSSTPSSTPSGGGLVTAVLIDDSSPKSDKTYSSSKIETITNAIKTALTTTITSNTNRIIALETQDNSVKLDSEMLEKNAAGEITVKPATSSTKGAIKVDNDTLIMTGDVISGKKYQGDNSTITMSSTGEFSLSSSVLNDIATMQAQLAGTIPPASLVYATATKAGIVRPDNTTIAVDSNGVMSVKNATKVATTVATGVVKPDGSTLAVRSDGTMYVRNPVNKLVQLMDVDSTGIANKAGQVVTVNDTGTGFKLAKVGESVNRRFETTVNSPSLYEFVYDFNQHVNTAISATLEIKNLNTTEPALVKFMGQLSGQIIEEVHDTFSIIIPAREFYVTLHIQGECKVNIDILSFI